jgi:hypothetical protein
MNVARIVNDGKFAIVPTIFPSRNSHYTSYLPCHTIPYIYATIILISHQFLKTNTGSTNKQANTRSVVEVAARILPSRYRAGRTRTVATNILAQQRRRNGTET